MWAQPHVGLSYDHAMRRESAEAEQEALRAIELDPHLPYAHNALGVALHDRRPDVARAAYSKALELDPHDPQIAYNLAMLERKKAPHAAVQRLTATLAAAPDYDAGRDLLDYILTGRIRAAFWITAITFVILSPALLLGAWAYLPAAGLGASALALHLWRTVRQVRAGMPGAGRHYLRAFARTQRLSVALAVTVAVVWAWLFGVSLAGLAGWVEVAPEEGPVPSSYAVYGVGLGFALIVLYYFVRFVRAFRATT